VEKEPANGILDLVRARAERWVRVARVIGNGAHMRTARRIHWSQIIR
jgi:hypothetical protein